MTFERRRLLRRVSGYHGETIVETLVALLVASFSLLMLAIAIRTSAIILGRTKEMANQYYLTTSTLVQTPSSSGSVAVAMSGTTLSNTQSVSWTGTTSSTTSLYLPGHNPAAAYTVTFS